MKIDAVSLGMFNGLVQIQSENDSTASNISSSVTEETGSSPDDFDDTRFAKNISAPKNVSSPVEKKQGSVEDLMNAQTNTEKMVHSFGFSDISQAAASNQSANNNSGFVLQA